LLEYYQLFFPYRKIKDQPWPPPNECIPVIRKATNSTSFQKSFLKLLTHINDTHAAGVSIGSPAIQGIREGKDEILLAALDCISGTDNKAGPSIDVKVYPNPVTSGSVTVSLFLAEHSVGTVTLIDLTGNVILKENRSFAVGEQTFELDLQEAAPGVYLLKIDTGKRIWVGKVAVR